MIWKRLPAGRTRIGSRIPFSRTEATSSVRAPILWRGWFGLGVMSSSGTSWPTGIPLGRPSWSTKCGSCRMRTVSGSPKRRGLGLDTFDDLLAEAVVLVGAAGLGSEGEDALLVGRALLEADALRDGGPEDAVAEDVGDGLAHVTREGRALVVERDPRGGDVEVGDARSEDDVGQGRRAVGQHVVHRLRHLPDVEIADRRVGLRIEVHEQRLLVPHGQGGGEVDRRRGLAHAALLV